MDRWCHKVWKEDWLVGWWGFLHLMDLRSSSHCFVDADSRTAAWVTSRRLFLVSWETSSISEAILTALCLLVLTVEGLPQKARKRVVDAFFELLECRGYMTLCSTSFSSSLV